MGKDSIDHPPGGNDDLANAAAGALVMAKVPASTGPPVFQRKWSVDRALDVNLGRLQDIVDL